MKKPASAIQCSEVEPDQKYIDKHIDGFAMVCIDIMLEHELVKMIVDEEHDCGARLEDLALLGEVVLKTFLRWQKDQQSKRQTRH